MQASPVSLAFPIKQDAARNVYIGNKFLTLQKSEVAKVATDRAGILGVLADREIGGAARGGEGYMRFDQGT
ncbi:hypothetical protein D7X25_21605 [bacterium 1XD42-8]|jgi:hypothetical protein|nr:hypothetical protein D7X25_21605 [bacterium 1XD42-8]